MLFLNERLDSPFLPGKIIFNEDDNAHLPLHWHSNVEICYFLQGGFRATVGNRCYAVRNEELIVVNSGQIHYVGDNSVGAYRGISLVADMAFWLKLCPELNELEFDLDACPERSMVIKQLMADLYEASLTYFQDKGPASQDGEGLHIYGLICLIYYNLTKYFSRPRKSLESHELSVKQTNLLQIIGYINAHYTEPMTLQSVAQQYSISCEHLSRIFKKRSGLTFREYLSSIRLAHAVRLLSHTEKNSLEVAMEAGFPDLRAFNRQFEKCYHLTPKEYREQVRNSRGMQLHN